MNDSTPDRPDVARFWLMVTAAVTAAWTLVGCVWGAQTALGSAVPGSNMAPVSLTTALRSSLVQTLPWIPVTITVVALTMRFPLIRGRWQRNLIPHLGAAPLLALVANMLVVLGFWMGMHRFNGVAALFRAGLTWATLRFHIALLIYVAIVAITQGALFYRRTRSRELQLARVEGQLALARLQALNAQIRPHFLFNTLHTIGQMWRSGRSEDADAMLDRLGSLFHHVQSVATQVEVPLADELDLVEQYLAIEQARFRDRLHTEITATPDARTRAVPPLLLQPIVENSVRHGISSISAAGRICVAAAICDGALVITVTDDGPGFGHSTAPSGSGTGLRNSRDRLAQLYGAEASLVLESPPGGGAVVHIRIPAVDESAAAHARTERT